jgi:hypothetical protein
MNGPGQVVGREEIFSAFGDRDASSTGHLSGPRLGPKPDQVGRRTPERKTKRISQLMLRARHHEGDHETVGRGLHDRSQSVERMGIGQQLGRQGPDRRVVQMKQF